MQTILFVMYMYACVCYYDVRRELAKKEQEIAATRKKYNALLRAADRYIHIIRIAYVCLL